MNGMYISTASTPVLPGVAIRDTDSGAQECENERGMTENCMGQHTEVLMPRRPPVSPISVRQPDLHTIDESLQETFSPRSPGCLLMRNSQRCQESILNIVQYAQGRRGCVKNTCGEALDVREYLALVKSNECANVEESPHTKNSMKSMLGNRKYFVHPPAHLQAAVERHSEKAETYTEGVPQV